MQIFMSWLDRIGGIGGIVAVITLVIVGFRSIQNRARRDQCLDDLSNNFKESMRELKEWRVKTDQKLDEIASDVANLQGWRNGQRGRAT
jgi:hypothetical protein